MRAGIKPNERPASHSRTSPVIPGKAYQRYCFGLLDSISARVLCCAVSAFYVACGPWALLRDGAGVSIGRRAALSIDDFVHAET